MWHMLFTFLGARSVLCTLILFLSGCVSVPDSRNLGSGTNPLHSSKDVVMTFPAWYSDGDKYKALNDSVTIKAKQKCQGEPYQLTDILSEPWSGIRINIISANIACSSSAMPAVTKPMQITIQEVQKQESTITTPPAIPVMSKETDLKKKCLRLGLVLGSDDFKLCMQSK